MGFLELIIAIACVGFLVWIIQQIPMAAPFKNIIMGLVVFLLVLYVLHFFGVSLPFGLNGRITH